MSKKYISIVLVALILLAAGITAFAAGKSNVPSRRAPLQQTGSPATVATAVQGSPRASMLPVATATPATRIDLEAPLAGNADHPTLAGKADYEVDRDGDREFEVGVRGATVLSGQSLDVYVDGTLVGQLTVDGNGFGRLKLDSERGHAVPVVTEGSTVELRLGGATISAGAFVIDTGDDDDDNSGGAAATPSTRIDLEARLTGSASHPTLAGKAEYEVDRDGDREFEVGVRGASALAGQSLDVYVDGTLVGQLTVDGNGFGRLKLDSERGHAVPVVTEGSTVELRLGGAVISAGAFVMDADDDDGDIDDIDDIDDDDDLDDNGHDDHDDDDHDDDDHDDDHDDDDHDDDHDDDDHDDD